MEAASWSLIAAAAGVALTHTLLGPDHYLPFVMLSRARRWSLPRTAAVTAACGLGHVLSSLLLATLGLVFGAAVGRIEGVEAARGGLAAWLLVAFGLAYGVWGMRRGLRSSRGIEPHAHDGDVHLHAHGDRPHRHAVKSQSPATFWTLFAIFVLGPCEPLIPLFVLPASRGRWDVALLAAIVFGVVTVGAMVVATVLGALGLGSLRLAPLEPWSHALAGGVVAASGLVVLFLGV